MTSALEGTPSGLRPIAQPLPLSPPDPDAGSTHAPAALHTYGAWQSETVAHAVMHCPSWHVKGEHGVASADVPPGGMTPELSVVHVAPATQVPP